MLLLARLEKGAAALTIFGTESSRLATRVRGCIVRARDGKRSTIWFTPLGIAHAHESEQGRELQERWCAATTHQIMPSNW